jgi:hypothetical protein
MGTEWVEVEVDYTESWARTGLASFDAAEIREAMDLEPDAPITTEVVQTYMDKVDWDDGKPWMHNDMPDHTRHYEDLPGVRDEFIDDAVDEVRLVEMVEAFALVRSFAPGAKPTYHLGREPYVNSDTEVKMHCGTTAVIPDRPVRVKSTMVCSPCRLYQRLDQEQSTRNAEQAAAPDSYTREGW